MDDEENCESSNRPDDNSLTNPYNDNYSHGTGLGDATFVQSQYFFSNCTVQNLDAGNKTVQLSQPKSTSHIENESPTTIPKSHSTERSAIHHCGKPAEICDSCGSTDHSTRDCLSNSIDMMKSSLKSRAEGECKKMTIPIKSNLKINPVTLQLTTNVGRKVENLDGKGHYNKRSDFANVMKPVEGGIELSNIFELSTAEARSRFSEEDGMAELYGNTVALIGQAGIGKTTLARKMLQLILNKDVLGETEFVFYIPFRQVNFSEETTLLKFALTGCTGWLHSDASDIKLLKKLQTNHNVVFIFDGLDEANTSALSSPTPHCNMFSSQKPDLFLARILTGDFFPKAKKLITSRPRQLFELHPDHRPTFVIDILGLNKSAQHNICEQICGNFSEKVIKYLEVHQDISACCYVPVNCIITMSILHDRLKDCGTVDVQSLTDIFVQSLDDFVRTEHVREKQEDIWKLGQLAWNGFSKNRIVFDETDIKIANIDEKAFQAFLCTYVKGKVRGSILQGDKKSSFSHLTWQELFVAVHIMVSEPLKTLNNYIRDKEMRKPLWEVISKFMFGLCNSRVMERLETILQPKVPISWDSKKDALYKLIHQSLKSTFSSAELFRLFAWIREANDDKLNERILDVFPILIDFDDQVFPTDITSVTYFMKYAAKPWSIQLGLHAIIDQDSFHLLCKQISSFPHKVQKVSLLFKNIPGVATSLAECVDKIEELNLCYCGLKSPDVEMLANKIVNFTQPMKKLDLSYNNIGNDGLLAITKCLGKISELHLRGCGFTHTGAEAFKDIITHDSMASVRLNVLDLSGNDLCSGGRCFIEDHLQHFERLELRDIGIIDAGAKTLAKKVMLLRQSIKLLDLSENNLGDAAAVSMSGCMKKIEELDLSYCFISKRGANSINDSLSALPAPRPRATGLLNQRNIKFRPKK